MNKFNQAIFLKVAAVAIAAPRYIGAFGASIGVTASEQLPWLIKLELYTGGAMALLEGFALAFILGKLALLDPEDYQHKLLKRFAWLLALTMPVVALPYLLTSQQGIGIDVLFSGSKWAYMLQIGWSLVILAVPVLIVMAVGYADIDDAARQIAEVRQKAEVKLVKQEVKLHEPPAHAKLKPLKPGVYPRLIMTGSFACLECNQFEGKSQKALDGHKAHCPARANHEVKETKHVVL